MFLSLLLPSLSTTRFEVKFFKGVKRVKEKQDISSWKLLTVMTLVLNRSIYEDTIFGKQKVKVTHVYKEKLRVVIRN